MNEYVFGPAVCNHQIDVYDSSDGEVKIWLEPEISVAKVVNLSNAKVNSILEIVKKRKEDVDADWNKHFG